MSHFPLRKQKDCLNCGTEVIERYCHHCGQENIEPKETVWHLITHFAYDITHFDGKFFSTVKYLLTKPGFLSREFIKGRRNSYLHPIKMYVFTSAIFFLFFFSVFKADKLDLYNDKNETAASLKHEIEVRRTELDTALIQKQTPESSKSIIKRQIALLNLDLERLKVDTANLRQLNYYKIERLDLDFEDSTENYMSVKEYEAAQAKLPETKRDGFLDRQYHLKKFDIFDKYGDDERTILSKILEKFMHFFPQMFFLSLPIFALLLRLLYIRRRKQFFYADHAIYSVHLYCATFIIIFIQMVLSRVQKLPYFHWVNYILFALFLYVVWYNYKALRNFYQQSRWKTILKFLLLFFLSSTMLMFLFIFFFIFSAMTI